MLTSYVIWNSEKYLQEYIKSFHTLFALLNWKIAKGKWQKGPFNFKNTLFHFLYLKKCCVKWGIIEPHVETRLHRWPWHSHLHAYLFSLNSIHWSITTGDVPTSRTLNRSKVATLELGPNTMLIVPGHP